MTVARPPAAGAVASQPGVEAVTSPLPSPLAAALPDGLRVRRAWPRGAGHLLLDCLDAGGAPVAGQWFADRDRLLRVAEATGRHGAVTVLPARGVLLQPGGADRRLPGLRGVVHRPGAALVVHRPERRAVVRLSGGGAYAKVVRPDRVAGVLRAAASVEGLTGVRTPRLVDVDADRGVVTWSAVAGHALYDRLAEPTLPAAARAAGVALRRLHDRPPPADAPVHDGAAEARVLDTWLAHRTDHCGRVPWAAEAAAAIRRALAAPGGPLVPVHRDFHDKQVLVDDRGTVGVIDFDTAAAGEAAVDVANMLVHLRWRAAQGRCTPAAAAAASAAFLVGYRPETWVRARLATYAAAARMRLWCVYAFRSDWAATATAFAITARPRCRRDAAGRRS